ncbi:MAG: PAS domain-containing protein [Chitinophagaceae bacterium]
MPSERTFENIVKQAPVGITILRGREMIVEMANETYLQVVDRRDEEFIGRSLYASLPEVREFVEPLLEKVFQTGIPYHGFEFPVILNRYGQRELTYFNFTYQALKDANNEISGIIVVANEVTTLVKTKQSIEESERQFKNLVMQSPIAMTIFRGHDFIIEIANETLLRTLWQKTEQEVLGKPILEIFPELAGQKYPALLTRVLDTGEPHRETEALALVRTQYYYLDFEYAPLRDAAGTVTGIMVTVYDVTEKVLARQSVEDTKERLRLAVEATGLSNWDLDLDSRSIIHSPRLAEIFGHPPDKILTHQELYAQVIPEDLQGTILTALNRALKTGVYQYEARIQRPDGATAWIKTQGKVVYDESGKPLKIIGTLRDITEEKAFSQELERQVRERTRELAVKNEELEKMNTELQSFAYVSSHDLQEPLRKIQVFSDRILELEQEKLSPKTKDYFGRIIRAASTMQTLIKDLLLYSRTSNSERKFEKTAIDDILNDVKEELHEEIEDKKAVVTSGGLGAACVIPFQFRQLLINLVSNSLKFSKEGSAPHIHLQHELVNSSTLSETASPGYYHLTVSDNGIGFDNEFKDKIFDIFQRLHGKDRFKGSGIGLAIVKKIVENHKGFIEARGERDKGATFDIYFPAGGCEN